MRIGILGLGPAGQMHARNLARTEGVSEIVLLGRDAGRVGIARDRIAAALAPDAPVALSGAHAPDGVPAPLTVGGDVTAELAGLDGIVIATSTATHPALTLQAAHAGVPALVEKPLTLEIAELTALADELDRIGSPVMVAFHRRYDPGHRALRERIAAGDAGAVRAVRGTGHDHHPLPLDYLPHSGGIWHDMMVHEFDTIPWVTGLRPVAVWAQGAVLDQPAHAEFGDFDSALAVIELEGGALATVSGTRGNGAGQDVRLEVFGTLDSYAAGFEARTPVTSTEPGAPGPAAPYDSYIDRFEPAFRAEARAFVDLARGEGENATPPRAGLTAIQLADAAAESARTGRRVALD
ncbi:Gfo/Idh/MocA family oxidoreductase [Micrococcales bacterium 31B]|nr:Gfo/Idh/MocA family oxidoreductase [Micrococcales bacterium 31B]